MENAPIALFAEAALLAQQQFYVDALQKFNAFVTQYPESELADDALFNAGMCHFFTNSFEHALQIFNEVIEKYPDSTIHEFEGGNAFGKTAAKCYYAIINSYLGMAKFEDAQSIMEKLKHYTDSYEITPLGEKITYTELAEKALATYSQFNIEA